MPSQSTIIDILTRLQRVGVSTAEMAAGAGVSVHTMRLAVEGRQLPKRRHAYYAIEAFAERNENATSRAEVRFS